MEIGADPIADPSADPIAGGGLSAFCLACSKGDYEAIRIMIEIVGLLLCLV